MERDNHFLKNGLLMLIYNSIALVDKGKHESIESIEEHMDNESLMEYIIEKYGSEEDFSLFDCGTYSKKDVNQAFWDITSYVKGNESRKYGVTNNGLNLLIAVAFDLYAGIK
ncbi:hypothetical protein [Dehalobacter sp. TeCB1]|jgi:hypothetical protein|uniref:hypothetical protein n=1 Tax=Dehalobacter sp. TeCB1 TaxID=1843715 RepID=UPI00083A6EDA|nr:hypothetical protein [Dehalobacter sp. TeCB1]OCZ49736.1 hypothetical protein A7D23_02590 [Dehalobacter sp. TeCB1]